MSLSERLRPNVDAPPWLIAEIQRLETFYELAVKERDLERVRNAQLECEVAVSKRAIEIHEKRLDDQRQCAEKFGARENENMYDFIARIVNERDQVSWSRAGANGESIAAEIKLRDDAIAERDRLREELVFLKSPLSEGSYYWEREANKARAERDAALVGESSNYQDYLRVCGELEKARRERATAERDRDAAIKEIAKWSRAAGYAEARAYALEASVREMAKALRDTYESRYGRIEPSSVIGNILNRANRALENEVQP